MTRKKDPTQVSSSTATTAAPSPPRDPEAFEPLRREVIPLLFAAMGRVQAVAAVTVTALGLIVLAGGWALGIGPLQGGLPGCATLKANTAIGFILAGTSLWLRRRPARRAHHVAAILGALVALLGAANLAQYLGGLNFGIDELLFRDPGALFTSHPGRMSPNTALSFLFAGSALALLPAAAAGWLAMAALLPVLLSVAGYLYGAHHFIGILSLTGMAVPTIIAFLLLVAGTLAARPQCGVARWLLSRGPEGSVLRRLMPASLAIVFFTAILTQMGFAAGLYGEESRDALNLFASSLALCGFFLAVAGTLERVEVGRRWAEEKIRHQNSILQGINRIFEADLSSGTEEELGVACLAVAEEVTGSRFGFIGEIGEDGLLHDIAISDPGWELCTMYDQTGHRRPPGDFNIHGVYGRVLLDGKGFFTNEPASHPDSIGTPAGHPPLTAFLGVPLSRDGRTIGMIAVGNREGGYGQDELEALEALGPAMVEALLRKRVEKSLRQSEAILAQAGQMASFGAWEIEVLNHDDINANPLLWSAEVYRIFGYSPGEVEVTNDLFFERVHPDDRQAVIDEVAQAIAREEPYSIEHRIIRPDGAVRIVHEYAKISYDVQGRPVHFIGAVQDITERKQAEEALRRAHDELEIRVRERTEELATTVETLLEEITVRERAEQSLQRLNRIYAVLSEIDQVIVRATDHGSLFREFCRIAVEHGGFLLSRVGLVDEESGRVRTVAASGETAYLDDIRLTVNEELEGEGPTGIPIRAGSHYICNDFQNDPCTRPWHAKGRLHGIRASASIALKEEERVIGALTLYAGEKDFFDQQHVALLRQMGADISFALDNMAREMRLRESERKFRTLFEESKDVILIMSAEDALMDVNLAGIDLFGFTREELAALGIANGLFCDPTERERFRQALLEHGSVRNFEARMQRKDGEILYVLMTATACRNEQGEIIGYQGIIHDVTERKRLEQQLLQAQNMESIGLLAGGIAHDFNNLLTAISGYSQIIQEQFAGKDEMLGMYIGQVLAAANRAAELTRNLLAFGRKQIINPRPVLVNDIVVNLSKLLTRVIGEDIEFGTPLAGMNLTVMADRGQIDQVLINLATNARDAMPKGGRLLVGTEQALLDKETAERRGLDKGGAYALITVSDTGIGMDAKTMERIFEPFYTTKETGKGTGLGLSIIYGIVRQHNGAITVESEPGKGSTFTIHLPLAEAAACETQAEPAPVPACGTETLLLAEDDPLVRKYMQKILEMAGYTVITAQNGVEAVEQFRENRGRISLVVCDVVMPKKSGKEVYDEIRAMSPAARVLFTSGYNDEIIHSKGILLDEIEYFSKPVNRQQLLAKLREMLDG